MIKVLVNGALGKMGQEVIFALEKDEDTILVGGFDKIDNGEYVFPMYTDYTNLELDVDVIIDFSMPTATFKMLEYANQKNIPVVIATTGFSDEETCKIKEYSKHIPIFKSGNMSYEVNFMCKLVAQIAKKLRKSDIEITETHHRRKIDAPSGTAMMLANSINEALDNTMQYEFNRHDKCAKRNENEIGIASIRGGNIVGEHSVQFFSENETFEIKHTAYSRQVFAEGAIKAAKYIIKQKVGYYDMDDLLKENIYV